MSVALDPLMPHRPPMRWIDALTACTDTTATATVSFSSNHFAVVNGAVGEAALVECVAQTVAAAMGQRGRTQGQAGRAGSGMLAAVADFKIHSRPPLDQPLHIEVRELKRFGPMLLVSGTVSCAGEVVAAGELTLYA